MTDERMTDVLRSWLRHRDAAPPDSAQTAAHVLARLPRVRRRRRWLRLPMRWHGRDAVLRDAEPRPLTDGLPIDLFPVTTRRTFTMSSPVKAIIAGSLVFAIGGMFIVAQPLDRQGAGAPAAEFPVAGITVTIDQRCTDLENGPEVCDWTASDPRLTGTLTHDWVGDISDDRDNVDEELRIGFSWLEGTLEGPEGTWNGRVYVTWTDPASNLLVLSGTGALDGWHYIASAISETGPPASWAGILYEGELPPFGPLSDAVSG